MLEILKILSEVIVESKCSPLARIEKQAMSKKADLLKSFPKIRVQACNAYKRSTIKDQKSNYCIPLDLRKRSSKIRENFVSNAQLNMI